MVPLKIVSNVSRFKPALHLNRVLADLNRGLNSLNSISGYKDTRIKKSELVASHHFFPQKKNFSLKLKFIFPIFLKRKNTIKGILSKANSAFM